MRLLVALFCFLTQVVCAKDKDIAWESCKQQTLSHLPEIHGWCTAEKATKMMDLIYTIRPTVCVEIGVFAGASIYPTASALQFLGKGQIYGIDPWTHEECLTSYVKDDANYQWWSQVDLENIYALYLAMIAHYDLEPYCTTFRTTSREAVHYFPDESIDILHIDGNHSPLIALEDAKLFLPKVRKGGYIWLDDIDWPETRLAFKYLNKTCVLDEEGSLSSQVALFQKPYD
ncbi:MAG: class I SAM-dependent methyltransferase [Verrucomicrobia bacterium]|nr:class I SAM-dependent methyltransferase [Verrucomicrobiota bacterium]